MMIRNLCRSLGQLTLTRNCSVATAVKSQDAIISPVEQFLGQQFFHQPREAWIENLDTVEENKLGIISLHPDIFGDNPRTDIIHDNIRWQNLYKRVDMAHCFTKAEGPKSNRKPWPQKGLGKARHGTRNSPLWYKGAKAHGPRENKTHFYMLPFFTRVKGLTATLSVKFAQDDLRIVPNFELPSSDPVFIQDLVEARMWGPSVLFVDTDDLFAENLSLATNNIKHMNLMPVYGLNVHSMLKHTTLVLTERAVREIEYKILMHLNRADLVEFKKKFSH